MLFWYAMRYGWVNAAPVAVVLILPVALAFGALPG